MLKRKCKYFFHLESIYGTKPNITPVTPTELYALGKQQQIGGENSGSDAEPEEGTSGERPKSRTPMQQQKPSELMPGPQIQKHVFDDSDEELQAEIQPLPKKLKLAPKQHGKGKKGNENIEEITKLNNKSQEKWEAMRIQANKELQLKLQRERLAAEAEKVKRDAERDRKRDESMQNLVRMLLEVKGKY